ncbi:hypothetical protein FRC10_007369 [Ceratobasidium sp. 414]|nr:hypothetical protein FRC10_007369 [Ceratobasidium sp. 414]
MSLFHSTSFRLKKREKPHRPPPLEQMPEHPAESRAPFEVPPAPASFLAVPDSARSAFFTLPSAVNSRSSLFTRSGSSPGVQEDKSRPSFFKFSNLSRGSFVATLRRERESRGRKTFDSVKAKDGATASFAHLSADLREYGHITSSKHPVSAETSMSNLLAGLDVIDIAPQPNSSLRQRSRTLSTKSAPDTPDLSLGSSFRRFADLPSPSRMTSTGRSSFDTPPKRRMHMSVPPRLSLDTPVSPGNGNRASPVPPPLLTAPLPALNFPPGRLDDTLPPLPSESSGVVRLRLHSPSPTIISATSTSTVQDSLMGSYDQGSSESDPDQSFTPDEDDCGPVGCGLIGVPGPSTGSEGAFNCYPQVGGTLTEAALPRLTVTRSGGTSPVETPGRPNPAPFSFPGTAALPDALHSPVCDPPETYFNTGDKSETSDDQITPLETVTSRIKPKLGTNSPATPARKLAMNAFRAGNTPPARPLRIRRPGGISLATISSLQSRAEEILEETPLTPPTPSFLAGLAWPRPPFRQIYVDTHKPESSWHAVSNIADEMLFDGSSNVRVEPCHIVMLAQAIDSLVQPQAQKGMCDQQPLSPSAAAALATFALHSRPLVSA